MDAIVSPHHTKFDRAVNTAAAARAQKPRTCDECKGTWWYRANRIFHTMSCSQNVLNKKPSRMAEPRLSAGESGRASRGMSGETACVPTLAERSSNEASMPRLQPLSPAESRSQDREAAALRDLRAPVLPSCWHGYESMLDCPGCSDAADRHNEGAVEL